MSFWMEALIQPRQGVSRPLKHSHSPQSSDEAITTWMNAPLVGLMRHRPNKRLLTLKCLQFEQICALTLQCIKLLFSDTEKAPAAKWPILYVLDTVEEEWRRNGLRLVWTVVCKLPAAALLHSRMLQQSSFISHHLSHFDCLYVNIRKTSKIYIFLRERRRKI